MKYKIGDGVQFTKDGKILKSGDNISNYFTEASGIPTNKIKHGSVGLGENYNEIFAIIKDIYKSCYLVEYEDDKGKLVTLGFKEDDLKLVNDKNYGKDIIYLKRLLNK